MYIWNPREGKITSGEDFTEVVSLGGGMGWGWLVSGEKEEQSLFWGNGAQSIIKGTKGG